MVKATKEDPDSVDECSIEMLRSCRDTSLQANLHIKMATNLKGIVAQDETDKTGGGLSQGYY